MSINTKNNILVNNISKINNRSYSVLRDESYKILHHSNSIPNFYPSVMSVANGAGLSSSQKKFGDTSLYLGSSSAKFNLNGTSISGVAEAKRFQFRQHPFTYDFWIRTTSTALNGYYFAGYRGSDEYMYCGFSDGRVSFYWRSLHIVRMSCVADTAIPAGEFVHIAIVRNLDTFKIYYNGIAQPITINSVFNITTDFYLEGTQYAMYNFNSPVFIDEYRISKGVARWLTDFTPPTRQYKADKNTAILCHFDTTYLDCQDRDESINLRPMYGNAYSSSKGYFGDSGRVFNGSTYMYVPYNSDLNINDGDFTLDARIKFTQVNSLMNFIKQEHDADNYFKIYFNNTVDNIDEIVIEYLDSGTNSFEIRRPFNPSIDNWYHLAITRKDGVIRIFINGILLAGGTDSGDDSMDITFKASTAIFLCQQFRGYLDEFRFSPGTATWDSNFTPPEEEYPVLLINGLEKINNIDIL